MYAAWEHEYRHRLARAHGVDHDSVIVPVFGDFRLLRHDILHCHGIATSEHAGACEVLRWFSGGDVIQLKADHYAEFVVSIPWAKMLAGPDAR
jgi:hypothetical protein